MNCKQCGAKYGERLNGNGTWIWRSGKPETAICPDCRSKGFEP